MLFNLNHKGMKFRSSFKVTLNPFESHRDVRIEGIQLYVVDKFLKTSFLGCVRSFEPQIVLGMFLFFEKT